VLLDLFANFFSFVIGLFSDRFCLPILDPCALVRASTKTLRNPFELFHNLSFTSLQAYGLVPLGD